MRWLVEVTSPGKTEIESLQVEGQTWQAALQAARVRRGESASMSGFSVDVLDEGCRALDSMSLARYDIRPNDAPGAADGGAPPSSGRNAAAEVPSQIVFKREQERTAAVPLTYREYVYVVPPGTSEQAANELLQAQLELVRTSLERAAAGKLVNLAVFDAQVQGKPRGSPVATLSWKDWRGAPVVAFPRRPTPTPARPLSVPPSAPSSSPPIHREATAAVSAVLAPPGAAESIAVSPEDQRPPVAPSSGSVAPPSESIAPSSEPIAPSSENVVVSPAPSAATAAPADVKLASKTTPRSLAQIASPQPGGPGPSARPAPVVVRVRDEELIADLFEAMHDLHFFRDAVEGGEFCLALGMQKIPCQAGIVHLYDINRREFVVTNVRGTAPGDMLLRRHPEGEPLLAAAMRKRRAIVVADASDGPEAAIDRYIAAGGARSIIVAPVMISGRYLGAIELMNPLDGNPFTPADGNAMSYIADQYAQFVADRGVTTDPERVASRRTQRA